MTIPPQRKVRVCVPGEAVEAGKAERSPVVTLSSAIVPTYRKSDTETVGFFPWNRLRTRARLKLRDLWASNFTVARKEEPARGPAMIPIRPSRVMFTSLGNTPAERRYKLHSKCSKCSGCAPARTHRHPETHHTASTARPHVASCPEGQAPSMAPSGPTDEVLHENVNTPRRHRPQTPITIHSISLPRQTIRGHPPWSC